MVGGKLGLYFASPAYRLKSDLTSENRDAAGTHLCSTDYYNELTNAPI